MQHLLPLRQHFGYESGLREQQIADLKRRGKNVNADARNIVVRAR
jgi:hypothetical protein